MAQHSLTVATVIRAGDTTALVSLPEWCGGVILVHVPTRMLTAETCLSRRDLPGVRLYVRARLTAATERDLDLQQWSLDVSQARTAA
ncbi:hypothetical protein J7I98_28455 [Streptomyces sp. ISL-98]|uniref:hypothetical protein n=1 Tax=Streptomyces sp. ISL-98 TaxID=2819192 RepID=UPI001BE9437C|nr:hypothetical protein [Streptomyces sp. ISL-98]MBT2509733.1 hypothetical protein [Streptomyces sp. ISL-98]